MAWQGGGEVVDGVGVSGGGSEGVADVFGGESGGDEVV